MESKQEKRCDCDKIASQTTLLIIFCIREVAEFPFLNSDAKFTTRNCMKCAVVFLHLKSSIKYKTRTTSFISINNFRRI